MKLGFINAEDMGHDGPLFRSQVEWAQYLKSHCRAAVDQTCWGNGWTSQAFPSYP